jgi:hypothetical protein
MLGRTAVNALLGIAAERIGALDDILAERT